jgi:hypothetical protein
MDLEGACLDNLQQSPVRENAEGTRNAAGLALEVESEPHALVLAAGIFLDLLAHITVDRALPHFIEDSGRRSLPKLNAQTPPGVGQAAAKVCA